MSIDGWKDIIIAVNAIIFLGACSFMLLFQPSRWVGLALVATALLNIILRIVLSPMLFGGTQARGLNQGEADARQRHTNDIDKFIAKGRRDNE
jgi:hypothetical protein